MALQPSTSTALVRKRTDTDLMPPPPPAKRIKRPKKIIDEDTYTDALSKIIARDFFPGLLESETQREYLDALESNDPAWISSAGRRLQHVMTPGRKKRSLQTPARMAGSQTPTTYVGDTPVSRAPTAMEEKTEEIDTNMSLASFQAQYTSEDNESFYKLLDRQNQKKADKYAWLWNGNKMPSKQMIKQKEVETRLSETRSLVDDGYKRDRLAIKDRDERPAKPDAWEHKPRNGLMFTPGDLSESVETMAERAQAESRAAPKSIVYENTRFAVPRISEKFPEPSSPSLSAIRDAIAGKRRPSYQESSAAGAGETPRVNGYAFVDDEEPDEAVPSLPKIDLGPGDAIPNPFKLQEQRKRESLHHRMVDRISESKRTSARNGFIGKVEKTAVPKFPSSPRVTGGLTPAAQRLWGKIEGGKDASRTPFNPSSVMTPGKGRGSGLKKVVK